MPKLSPKKIIKLRSHNHNDRMTKSFVEFVFRFHLAFALLRSATGTASREQEIARILKARREATEAGAENPMPNWYRLPQGIPRRPSLWPAAVVGWQAAKSSRRGLAWRLRGTRSRLDRPSRPDGGGSALAGEQSAARAGPHDGGAGQGMRDPGTTRSGQARGLAERGRKHRGYGCTRMAE